MADPFAAIEAEQEERRKVQSSTTNTASSTTAKLSRLRGKLFAKHSRPDADHEPHASRASEVEASAPSELLSSSRQLRTQQDEVDDFLHGGPAIPAPVAGPRRNLSLLAPRLNLAAARNASNNSEPDERWQPTKPRRREGLNVSFDVSQVLVIGFGGDDAREPVVEVGRGKQVLISPETDNEPHSRTAPQAVVGNDNIPGYLPKDYPAVRPSTGYRQSQGYTEPLTSTQNVPGLADRLQQAVFRAGAAESRSLRHLRAEEGLTFRSAMGLPSENEDISRPSSSGSSGPENKNFSRKLAAAASSVPQLPVPGSMPLSPKPLAVATTDNATLQVASQEPTYLTPPPSQGGIIQPEGHPEWTLEQDSPPSATKAVTHPPRLSSRPPPAQSQAPQSGTDGERISASGPNSITADRNDEFPNLRAFGAQVAHLATIFNARLSSSVLNPGPSDWARAATWWFLRARGGLEELVRSSVAPQDTPGLSLLKAHLVNLAKVWWIMVNVLPTLTESPMSTAVEKTRNSLAVSFEALLRSMEKRELFPTQSLEIVSGLDTSVWTSEPVVLDTREAQTLRHWFPAPSLIPQSIEDKNAFPNLPIVELLHHSIYLRGFARGILTSTAGPEAPPDTFPIFFTGIRSNDSYQPSITITTQCGSVDLAASLVPISQYPAAVRGADPVRRIPSAVLNPRNSSIAITLPSLAGQKDRRIIQVFLRPLDFSKLTALDETCVQALRRSKPSPLERDLVHASLSQCQVTCAMPNASNLSIQSSVLRIFGEIVMHDKHQLNKSGEVSHDSSPDIDALQSSRPRARTGLGADRHRSPRHLGASLLNKGLNTLRARSRSRSEPAAADQPRSSSHERDEAEDMSTGWNDDTDQVDRVADAEGGSMKITRLSVVTDVAGRRIDSMESAISGADGWCVDKVDISAAEEGTSSVEQLPALRFVLARSPSNRAGTTQHVVGQSLPTTKHWQEWMCVFMERQQRDQTMRILQSLQRQHN